MSMHVRLSSREKAAGWWSEERKSSGWCLPPATEVFQEAVTRLFHGLHAAHDDDDEFLGARGAANLIMEMRHFLRLSRFAPTRVQRARLGDLFSSKTGKRLHLGGESRLFVFDACLYRYVYSLIFTTCSMTHKEMCSFFFNYFNYDLLLILSCMFFFPLNGI